MDDPRLTPARPEVAAKYLEGKVEAARFAEGEVFEVTEAIAPVRRAPASDAEQLTQALKGERVTVYDRNGEGFAWGQLGSDGYVGWLPESALTRRLSAPTHKVTALWTFAFAGPSIKLPPVMSLPMGAVLEVDREHDGFAVIDGGYCVPRQHLGRLDARATDFVAVAERFVGTPYLWGGKSAFGIDCSGLVQVALQACGIACPRDTDMQEKALGQALAINDLDGLKRGDLVFWNGHVGIMADQATLLHANGHHMQVVMENFREALTRIAAGGSEVTSLRRL